MVPVTSPALLGVSLIMARVPVGGSVVAPSLSGSVVVVLGCSKTLSASVGTVAYVSV